jgi:2-polyprenyl-3-methyl-5-hydroxy-6-metoxy-1,4-benzoquinol methylase
MYETKPAGYFSNPRPEMIAFVPSQARRLLDFGCGDGAFGAALKAARGIEVVGVEPASQAAEAARQRLDRVVSADIQSEALPLEARSFDCVVCNDVLEHLADPWTALQRLRDYVRPGGWLVASIPNVRHHRVVRRLIWPGEWRYEDDGVLDRTHLRFFTKRSATDLVAGAGFQIERVEGINRSSLPAWLRVINGLASGAFDDMQYLQFAIVARSA